MREKAHVRAVKELARSRFLTLNEIDFVDDRGRQRRWDAVNRAHSMGAVVIVATLRPGGRKILVEQFRPPAAGLVIEFPAGLIDPGEDAETAAHRELWEETGYRGEVRRIHPPAFNSPGLSGETVTIVEMDVDAAQYPEAPENHPEDSESIRVLLLSREEFPAVAAQSHADGKSFDSKVITHFSAGD